MIIISHFILFLLIIFANGKFFINSFGLKKLNYDFFKTSLLGLIFTTFFAQIINFVIPLNNYVIYFNALFALIVLLLTTKNSDFFYIRKLVLKCVFFLILILVAIYGSGFSDDINHYHYGFIHNSDVSNYIVGLSHLNPMYGLSSIWLTSHSYFNFDEYRLQDIHILNGILYFLFLSYFFSEITGVINKKRISIYSCIVFSIIIFVLLKYTRLKEFGVDRSGFLIFYFYLLIFLKNFIFDFEKKNISETILILTYLSLFLIFFKITFLFTAFIPLYCIIKYKKYKLMTNLKFLPIYFIFFSYILKNIFFTGCLIFPIPETCFDFLNWNNKIQAENQLFLSEVLNKSWWTYKGNLNELEYVKNFNWFKTWFVRHSVEIFEFTATALIILIISLAVYKNSKKKYSKVIIKKNYELSKIIFILLIFVIYIFISKNPVIRMNHFIFIMLILLLILLFKRKFYVIPKKNMIYLVIFLSLTFNFSKNILRISESNFVNNPKIILKYKISIQNEKQLGEFKYYLGWYGNAPVGNKSLDNYKYKKYLNFHIIHK